MILEFLVIVIGISGIWKARPTNFWETNENGPLEMQHWYDSLKVLRFNKTGTHVILFCAIIILLSIL